MSTQNSTARIIPAGEIKRRGISSLDELLDDGPVYVIKNGRARYVVLREEDYQELLEGYEETERAHIRQSLLEAQSANTKRGNAEDTIRELGLEP
jgi:PHD/YefM family antitoxin component YafN of YafNO toxin-antitoxin module